MNYTREDYAQLYGDHWVTRSSLRARLVVAVLLVGWICAILLVAGCDGQAAEATHESVMVAYDKKQALMGHPCTYVAQCGLPISDCPVRDRVCVEADLTERK